MSWRALFTHNMEQVSFHFCSRSQHSVPLRNFLVNNYADLALLNPRFRFLVRENANLKPYIIAQYFANTGDQVYFKYNVEGMSETEVEELMKRIAFAGAERSKQFPDNPKQFIPWKDIAEANEDY